MQAQKAQAKPSVPCLIACALERIFLSVYGREPQILSIEAEAVIVEATPESRRGFSTWVGCSVHYVCSYAVSETDSGSSTLGARTTVFLICMTLASTLRTGTFQPAFLL